MRTALSGRTETRMEGRRLRSPWFALPASIVPCGRCSPTPASGGGGAAAPPHGVPAQLQAAPTVTSLGVAVGMRAVPVPGRGDDLLDVGQPRLPVQVPSNARGAGDQHGGVPGPPCPPLGRDGGARDPAPCPGGPATPAARTLGAG